MPNSTIWIVVASEEHVSIRASSDGVSRLVQSMDNYTVPGKQPAYSRCGFACSLMLELCRGELAHAFDSLIVVADAEMMRDLRCFMTHNVSGRLIAEIVTEAPDRYRDMAFVGETLSVIENHAFL